MKVLGIIPARYNSTRLPGKPLVDLDGKSMIWRVYERSKNATRLDEVIVATDDSRIYDHVSQAGGKVQMTSPAHPSGTDRCQEVIKSLGVSFDYVVNIQGDEPLIDPGQIDELVEALDGSTELATQVMKINDPVFLFNPSSVKVVMNANKEALYFSRSPIPHFRNVKEEEWHKFHDYYRHAGMYAYRADILEKITALPISSLEKAESLEQLRWLENGFKIKCIITEYESLAVDTAADVEVVINKLKEFKS